MEPGICRNLLTPLAFYVKTRAFEVLGIIRHKLDFGGIYRNDFFQVGQEYCAAVFYKGRNTNTMQTLLVKVVSLNLFNHPFLIADDYAHSRRVFYHFTRLLRLGRLHRPESSR